MMPNGNQWPEISIVTPSYNQGEFIEETIRSVLLQGYPNLQYIVIDGGSTDKTLEVISKYSDWLSYWVSERDKGQSHAINKGIKKTSGEIFNWINSDDLLTPNSLQRIAEKSTEADIVAGACKNFGNDGYECTIKTINLSASSLIECSSTYHQPAIWIKKNIIDLCGPLREDMYFYFDWEWYIRLLEKTNKINYTDELLARFRLHQSSKTVSVGDSYWFERREALFLIVKNSSPPVSRVAELVLRKELWAFRLEALEKNAESSRPIAILGSAFVAAFSDPLLRLSPRGGLIGLAKRLVRKLPIR